MSILLGIDSSTTATKAILVDPDGAVIGSSTAEYGFETPQLGWAEQHPDLWWQGAVQAIGNVMGEAGVNGSDIASIGLTGQMHGLVMLDREGAVIRPALLWNDQRTEAECDEIRDAVGFERLVAVTGNDAMTGFTAPKIAWVRNHEPEAFDRVASIMLPKDYLRWKLTGEIATDVADGSGTLLMDVARRSWSELMVDTVGLRSDQMPELFESPSITGTVTREAADQTDLAVGTAVVGGGGDQAANAVGVGAVDVTTGALSLGTSGVVFVASDRPVIEPYGRVHAFCHAVPDRWHAMGVMLSAAGSLRWYRDTLARGVPFEALVAEAATVPPGADGLRFLPYLTGERTPHFDPNARGGFIGLTVGHARPHFTRAVLEGVAFGLADGLDLMRDAGLEIPPSFHASGGGTRSSLWRQIIADVLGSEVATVRTVEGAAFGAALLAGVGAGVWSTVDESVSVVETVDTTRPGPDAGAHRAAAASYRDLYPALKDIFPELSPSGRPARP